MTGGGETPDGSEDPEAGADDGVPRCAEADCGRPAAVRVHVPWAEDRAVCTGHARVIARQDGVVAEPIEGAESEWP